MLPIRKNYVPTQTMMMRHVKLLDELLAKSQEALTIAALGSQSGSTTITFGNQNSGFQAGVIHGGVNYGK